MKKTEYGPGYINAIEVEARNVETTYLVEQRSVLNIDRKSIDFTHVNVKELLYGNEFGKSSR